MEPGEIDLFMTINAMIRNDVDMVINVFWKDTTFTPDIPCQIQIYKITEDFPLLSVFDVDREQGCWTTDHQYEEFVDSLEACKYFVVYMCGTLVFKLYTYKNYGRCLQELRRHIGDQLISEVAFLGAHDAGAIKRFQPGTSDFLLWFYDLYITQRITPYDMCLHGVRYFDLRMEILESELEPKRYWLYHGNFVMDLQSFMAHILRFVAETKEPLILDFHEITYEDFMRQDGKEEMETFRTYFEVLAGDFLFISQDIPTLNQVWASGRLLIISSPNVFFRDVFPVFSIEHIWGNKGDVGTLIEYFDRKFTQGNNFANCKSYNIEVTRNYLIHPRTGLREYANRVNSILNYKLLEPSWRNSINILSLDFVLSCRGMDIIYKINEDRFPIAN